MKEDATPSGEPDPDESPSDKLIQALDRGDAALAATILRQTDALSKQVREAIADMLDSDPLTDETLRSRYPYRLQLTRWPGKTRPPKSGLDHNDDIDTFEAVNRKIREGLKPGGAIKEVAKSRNVSPSKVEKAYYKIRSRMLFGKRS